MSEPTEEMILSGMEIAPVEPVLEMIDAAEQVDWSRSDTKASIVNVWKAINHQIMPVRLTGKMIEAALPVLMREDDQDKHRALGQLICVWDALIDAANEEQRNDNESMD